MLLAAVALSFFGMFVMFYSIVRGQDRTMKFINKKHKEFIVQLTKIEETVASMAQLSNRVRSQTAPTNYFSEVQADPNTITQNEPATFTKIEKEVDSKADISHAQVKSSNVEHVNLDDVFPSDALSKNSKKDAVHLEDVFTLQPDMTVDNNQNSKKAYGEKSSMLELLQL